MIANEYGRIQPVSGIDYRDLDLDTIDAFTWADGITQTGEHGLYGVEFISIQNLALKSIAPEKFKKLHKLDDLARLDAEAQPGFNVYYADPVSKEDDPVSGPGRARSFCLWDSREDAVAASLRQPHQNAVRYTFGEEGRDVYGYYGIHKFKLEKTPSGLVIVTLARMAVSHGEIVVNWTAPVEEGQAA